MRYMTVTSVDNDHNIGLVSRELEEKLAAYRGSRGLHRRDPGRNQRPSTPP